VKRWPVLALVLAAWFAPAAAAQDKGTPVVGGGSFNSAPLLEPGTYRDTILPTEYLYYGFRLQAGQYLRVTVTLPDIPSDSVRRMGVIWLAGNIHTPTRTRTDVFHEREGDKDYIGFGGPGPNETLVVSSDDVSAEQDDSERGAWRGAGVYYLALHATTGFGTTDPVRAEIPLTFHAEIVGEAQPNATPSPTQTPTPATTATPAKPEETAESDGGPSAAVAAVGGVGGLLIGVIAGIARRRRRG
jgi:Ca-activated chloride channel family protein